MHALLHICINLLILFQGVYIFCGRLLMEEPVFQKSIFRLCMKAEGGEDGTDCTDMVGASR